MPTGSPSQPFTVDLLSKSEYYPYGMLIDELSYDPTGARYGYNGTHEQDKEVNADGNFLDFGNFGYDTRVAMRRNQEPLRAKYPYLSGYSAFQSNPIMFSDPDGAYPINIHTKSYAPFKIFGFPFDRFYGDSRGHTLDRGAPYRTLASINYDTETRQTSAFGGLSLSHNKAGTKSAISRTNISDRSAGSNIDVHSFGNNVAEKGSWDIDQFTKLKVTIEGDINKNHILNISGTVSGDDFPNQESMVYDDSKVNGLWLGNYETSKGDILGPIWHLMFEDEGDIHINVNIRISVNKDGIFQGVMQKGKDGKETQISIDDWNKKFKSDDKK